MSKASIGVCRKPHLRIAVSGYNEGIEENVGCGKSLVLAIIRKALREYGVEAELCWDLGTDRADAPLPLSLVEHIDIQERELSPDKVDPKFWESVRIVEVS